MNKDIRIDKRRLREKYKDIRIHMQEKDKVDKKIFNRVINTWAYRDAQTLLVYVSTKIEVDTIELINHALNNNKKVAVPYCLEEKIAMKFYYINSIEELEKRTFGVLEPVAEKSVEVESFDNSICIVPALAFDKRGFRLGYGKGYYDRFLSSYDNKTLGICYEECICQNLPTGKFDRRVNTLITNKSIYNFD